jgi:hypothetical protein
LGRPGHEFEHAVEIIGRVEPNPHFSAARAIDVHGNVSLQETTQTVCEPTHFRHLRYCLRALNVTRSPDGRFGFLHQAFDFTNTESL